MTNHSDSATEVRDPSHENLQPALLSNVPFLTTRLVRENSVPLSRRCKVSGPEALGEVLTQYFRDRDREEFLTCHLDQANSLTGISVVSIGGLASSVVEPRQVFKAAILGNAAAVILAHNHPSGNTDPSPEDVAVTEQLVEAGAILGIPVRDHLIIAEDNFCSLARKGLV